MRHMTLLIIAFLVLSSNSLLTPSSNRPATQVNSNFASSNDGIANIQVTLPLVGPATNWATGNCVQNASLRAGLESTIAVDPKNADHLVGTANFIYQWAGPSFSASIGTIASLDGGRTWKRNLITGLDCTNPNFKSLLGVLNPSIAIDGSSNLYAGFLAVSAKSRPIYVTQSTDGGLTWTTSNQGKPVFDSGSSTTIGDRPTVMVDDYPSSPNYGTVYVVWGRLAIKGSAAIGDVMLSKSSDHGDNFSQAVLVSPQGNNSISYVNPVPAIGPDGTLYVSFASTSSSLLPAADSKKIVYVVRSQDGGRTFSAPIEVAETVQHGYVNTQFVSSVYQSIAVNPSNGHLLLAFQHAARVNSFRVGNITVTLASKTDILLYESTDGGRTWNKPLTVNDNPADENETAFQPTLAASPNGLVAVAFYDRRLPCPSSAWIMTNDTGKTNLCIDTALQIYNDKSELSAIGNNIRVTQYSWDPMNPGDMGGTEGLRALWFIGDYFGLTLTNETAYTSFTANFDLGQNPGQNPQVFVARVALNQTGIETQSQTGLSSQTASAVEQTSPLMEESGLIIAGILVVAAAALATWVGLKRRKRSVKQ